MVLAPAGDPRVLPEIQAIARVGRATQGLRESRIGVIGSVMGNLVAAHYHRDVLADRLGPETVHITLSEVKAAMESVPTSAGAVKGLIEELNGVCAVGANPAALGEAVRFHLALRRLVDRLRLHAVTMECLTELVPLWGVSPCLGFARPGEYLIGCEGDVVMTGQALLLYYLTGSDSYMGDIFSLDEEGVLTLRHCAASLRLGRPGQKVQLGDQLPPATLQMDRQLVMCKPQLARGPVTLTRLHGAGCNQLHLALGDIVEAEDDDRPIVHIRLRNPKAFLDEVCGNHYLVTYDDLREQLKLLVRWLGLELLET
jgi:L-fucose isomerase-like protein